MPVVVLRQVPGLMVQKTVEPPLFQFIVGRRHPLRSAEADPHGPVCSADHRDSSVAVRFQVVDDPVVLVVRFHRLFISVYSALLGPTVDTFYASVYGVVEFHVFLRAMWITDPEVDSRLSDHVLLPLVSGSHLFVASPEEYMIWIFWEMTSGIIFRCSALGSTVDTCVASVYEVLSSFTYFLRESELGS